MPSAEVAWLSAIDFEFLDGRFGAPLVNRLLRDPLSYVEPSPRADADGRLVAALDVNAPERRAGGFTLAVRVRRPDDPLEVACVCSQGGRFVCEHKAGPAGQHPGVVADLVPVYLQPETAPRGTPRGRPHRATTDDFSASSGKAANTMSSSRSVGRVRASVAGMPSSSS